MPGGPTRNGSNLTDIPKMTTIKFASGESPQRVVAQRVKEFSLPLEGSYQSQTAIESRYLTCYQ